MRQVGTLASERDAQRLAAWLMAQRIEAHAERDGEAWALWVRNEDHLQEAREALAHFQANPQDPKYQGVERSAEAVLREEETRRRQAQSNIVEMRSRWGSASALGGGVSRRCPMVLVLIGASILIYMGTNDQGKRVEQAIQAQQPIQHNPIYAQLVFTDPRGPRSPDGGLDIWASVRRGQVWRLVTPIFIHYGLAHIALNMIWLYSFGGLIEDRRGSRFLAALVLILALTSNVGQAVEASLREQGALFGGMSGVGYGLFGYMLVKVKFDNRDRYFLSRGTAFIALLWFVLCLAREVPPFASMLEQAIPPIANSAHAVGLAVGAAIAYAPILVRKPA